jgi:acetyltransferase-like isoleucine patch superfamily enzyme
MLLFGLIFISPPFLKKIWLRWFCGAKLGQHAHLGWFSSVMARGIELGAYSVIRPLTLINLEGKFKLGHYSELSSFTLIYGSANLVIGNKCYVGPQCLINADEEVRLGDSSALGPRSMVFTHGSFLPYTEGYWVKLAGVTLGNHVWCAAGVFLHPGVEIGDDSFVNSRSVVTGAIPPGSVVEGNPAKVIYPMERVKRKMSPLRVDAAMAHILRDFAEIGLRREMGITHIEETKDRLRFNWRGQRYHVALILSTGDAPPPPSPESAVRSIFIVNRANWTAPLNTPCFELATMQTPFSSDPIHTSLRLFMQRYYGLKFTDQQLS